MKNILLIAYYYLPQNNGGVQRIVNLKKYLSRYGFNVYILTTNAYGDIHDNDKVFRFSDTGVKIASSRLRFLSLPFRLIRRILIYFGFITDWYALWTKDVQENFDRVLNGISFDYIMASYPPIADLEIGEYLSERYDIPLIIDYRDGFLYEPFKEITKQSKRYHKKARELERRISEKSVLNIVVNDSMKKYYETMYSTSVVKIENGFDDEEVFDESDTIDLPSGFNIVYTGSLSLSIGAVDMNIIQSLIERNDDSNFVFIGSYTKNEMDVFSVYKNVYVYEKQSRDKIIPIQRRADLLLLCSGELEGGTSGKLFEYIFSGTPILNIGGKNDASVIIDNTHTGETFLGKDATKIREYILAVRSGEYSISPKDLEKYTRREQIKKLASVLDSL